MDAGISNSNSPDSFLLTLFIGLDCSTNTLEMFWQPTSSKLYDSCLNSLEENSSCVSNNATAETGVTRTLVAEDLNNKSRSSSVTVTADDTDSSSDQDIVETASASGTTEVQKTLKPII